MRSKLKRSETIHVVQREPGEEDTWESLSEDENDEGGEEGLKAVKDPKAMRERRMFEIEFEDGEVQTFEVRSGFLRLSREYS